MKKSFTWLSVFLFIALMVSDLSAQQDDLFKPFGSGAGKCYGKAMITYQFDTIEERLVVRPAYSYRKEIPAKYETVTERILVEPAHTRYEVIPAQFKTIRERVLLKDAESYVTLDPPPTADQIFQPTTEKIEVAPASQRWEKTRPIENCKSEEEKDCLEWQLVDIPPQYITTTKYVRADLLSSTPSSQKVVTKEPQYREVIRKELVKESEYRKVNVPAKYTSVTKQKLVESRRFEQVTIPAEYKTIKKVIVIKEGGVMEAKEVICEEEYPRYIYKIQEKLKSMGYDVGRTDGVLGKKTKEAIMDFQAKRGLPIGQLDYGTIKALNLIK